MASRVLRLVLDQLSSINDVPYFDGANQSLRSRHLSDCMRQEQNPLRGCRPNPLNHRLRSPRALRLTKFGSASPAT